MGESRSDGYASVQKRLLDVNMQYRQRVYSKVSNVAIYKLPLLSKTKIKEKTMTTVLPESNVAKMRAWTQLQENIEQVQKWNSQPIEGPCPQQPVRMCMYACVRKEQQAKAQNEG